MMRMKRSRLNVPYLHDCELSGARKRERELNATHKSHRPHSYITYRRENFDLHCISFGCGGKEMYVRFLGPNRDWFSCDKLLVD